MAAGVPKPLELAMPELLDQERLLLDAAWLEPAATMVSGMPGSQFTGQALATALWVGHYRSADAEELEDTVADLDDAVAAAIWCGRPDELRVAADQLKGLVRDRPAAFAPLRGLAAQVVEGIGGDDALYDFWRQILSP